MDCENIIWDEDSTGFTPRFRTATEQKAWLKEKRKEGMTRINKLELFEALEQLPDEMAKFNSVMQDETFKTKFYLTDQLDMSHPDTQTAISQVGMDVDVIKEKIIEQNPITLI